jgi:hypothetical protein
MIQRRKFITLLVGAAAWPLAARAQQPQQMRRIGVLMSLAANDAQGQARLAGFLQGLQQLGWIDGRNVRIDTRWAPVMPIELIDTQRNWLRHPNHRPAEVSMAPARHPATLGHHVTSQT